MAISGENVFGVKRVVVATLEKSKQEKLKANVVLRGETQIDHERNGEEPPHVV